MINIVNKLFGSIKSNSLKKYASFVEKVNKLEEGISKLSDKELNSLKKSIPDEIKKIGIENIFFISAATGHGTKELLNALTQEISIIRSELT